MVDLPKKKVGIVACSGEELPEGTVTRLAALKVLEELRPADSVTICLPLFLAGGEGDRAFARFYPTIAVDGCEQRCAAKGTERYSAKPAASIVVTQLVDEHKLEKPKGARKLDEAGSKAVELTAGRIADLVDDLLGNKLDRRSGVLIQIAGDRFEPGIPQEPIEATCACGSGIPVSKLMVAGKPVTIAALPLICDRFRVAGKLPSDQTAQELLDWVKIYNQIPADEEPDYKAALLQAYADNSSENGSAG